MSEILLYTFYLFCFSTLFLHGIQKILIRTKYTTPSRIENLTIIKYFMLWYLISISLTLYIKWFLKEWKTTGFPFPITMTTVHMIVKLLLSRLVACRIRIQPYSNAIYWK